jgi:hypothetical protein
MMAQINSAKLPDELLDIQVSAQVSVTDCLVKELRQQFAPLTLHNEDMLPHRTLGIIQLEQSGSYGTSAAKPGPARPVEPAIYQRLKTRQPFGGLRGRRHNVFPSRLRTPVQQSNLQFFF